MGGLLSAGAAPSARRVLPFQRLAYWVFSGRVDPPTAIGKVQRRLICDCCFGVDEGS
jgi:hypothetical protein